MPASSWRQAALLRQAHERGEEQEHIRRVQELRARFRQEAGQMASGRELDLSESAASRVLSNLEARRNDRNVPLTEETQEWLAEYQTALRERRPTPRIEPGGRAPGAVPPSQLMLDRILEEFTRRQDDAIVQELSPALPTAWTGVRQGGHAMVATGVRAPVQMVTRNRNLRPGDLVRINRQDELVPASDISVAQGVFVGYADSDRQYALVHFTETLDPASELRRLTTATGLDAAEIQRRMNQQQVLLQEAQRAVRMYGPGGSAAPQLPAGPVTVEGRAAAEDFGRRALAALGIVPPPPQYQNGYQPPAAMPTVRHASDGSDGPAAVKPVPEGPRRRILRPRT